MCGRTELHLDIDKLVERFAIQQQLFEPKSSYNIAPSQIVPVITQRGDEGRALEGFKWGLVPSWAKDPKIGYKMINARAEGIETKPSFKNALVRRRCLVPVTGFYEWRKLDAKNKQPYHIGLPDDGLFALAGLWEYWKSPEGEPLKSFTIITTSANEQMQPLHDRMPVVLEPEDEKEWLDPENRDVTSLVELLRPYPDELKLYPVSKAVNSPEFDDPSCREPWEGA